ncbi:STOREKEEPER protein-like [Benincasa hispida]|uniref:STOREKEEPER protein-like n=1 Tax=Benincasa hispida TaxID=102211 RepID=UPI0019010101|nr:STOREKEEPER protein-like [Benincasa hispida]
MEEEKESKEKMPFRWSSTDECTILENFYEFAGKNGNYSKAFYHFVKGKLSGEVSNSQLSTKVYRLRKRFMKNKRNDNNNNNMREKFPDEKVFELSRNIWGDDQENPKSTIGGGGPSSSSSINIIQWKPEEVERFYEKRFKIFLENMKLDVTSIPTHVLEDVRKEWEDVRRARNDYELKNADLLEEISDIRCTQNVS